MAVALRADRPRSRSLRMPNLSTRAYASTLVRSEMKSVMLAATAVAVLTAANPASATAQATKPVTQVVQWNRTLLVIVRTPGAQPATIHPTRSFAIMHAAIYDAV